MKCKVVKKDSSDINKQFLDILNKYDNKPVDFEFVKEVLIILRKHYHCEETLKKAMVYKCFSSNPSCWSGFYSRLNYGIYINIAVLDNADLSINDRNAIILNLIFHEFIHALQEKRTCDCLKYSNFDNFEAKLIALSDLLKIEQQKDSNIYYAIPTERWAHIKSYIWCINVLSLDKEKYFDLIKKMKMALYTHILVNYEFIDDNLVSSLEKFLVLTNNLEDMYLIDKEGLSLEQRILYGLPISLEEYDRILNKHHKYGIKVLSKNKSKS